MAWFTFCRASTLRWRVERSVTTIAWGTRPLEGPARIGAHDERLRESLAVHRQAHGVTAVRHAAAAAPPSAAATAAATPAGAPPAAAARRRHRAQIPDPAVHAGRRRQRLALRRPDGLNVQRVRIARRHAVVARIAADDGAAAVEDLECQR